MKRKLETLVLVLLTGIPAIFLGWIILVSYVPDRVMSKAATIILTTFTVALIAITIIIIAAILATITPAAWGLWSWAAVKYHEAQLKGTEVMAAKRDAMVQISTAPPGYQVFATEVSGPLSITHKPIHLSPGRVNGHNAEYSLEEKQRYLLNTLAHSTTSKPDVARQEQPLLQAPLPDLVHLSEGIMGQPSIHKLFLGIGRINEQVRPLHAPLEKLVHVAVAGASGFGKSNCMQAIAYQSLNCRESVKVVCLDAQGVTFTPFDGHENLLYPIVYSEPDIVTILTAIYEEMNRRESLLRSVRGCASVVQYNSVVDSQDRLPFIPLLFDEFGLVSGNKEITRLTTNLSQRGRKCGILSVFGAQTWLAADGIASALKTNLSTTIQFYSKSKSQSRVLIDDSAAATIDKPGRAFCRLPGVAGLVELQVPFVDVEPSFDVVESADMPIIELGKSEEAEKLERFRMLVQEEGKSMNEAAKTVFGVMQLEGKLFYKCKQVLGE